MNADRLAEIRARADAATPGPWAWFGNTRVYSMYLATKHSGRRYVMTFDRWGMRGAQPRFRSAPGDDGLMERACDLAQYEVLGGRTLAESDREPYRHDISGIANPDAAFIANAREDIPWLLAEIDRLRAELDLCADDDGAPYADPCGCREKCGDDGDTDGPGTCKGLPRMPEQPLVEIALVPRFGETA